MPDANEDTGPKTKREPGRPPELPPEQAQGFRAPALEHSLMSSADFLRLIEERELRLSRWRGLATSRLRDRDTDSPERTHGFERHA